MASSQQQYGQVANYNSVPKTRGEGQSSALEVDNKGNLLSTLHDVNNNPVTPNPLNLSPYDYVSRSLAVDNVTETWTFKSGGSGGQTTNTIVIVYTDSSLGTILTVTKT